jgi:hypothetical protein
MESALYCVYCMAPQGLLSPIIGRVLPEAVIKYDHIDEVAWHLIGHNEDPASGFGAVSHLWTSRPQTP